MVNSEQVFDMLPHVTDLYDKLDLDTYRKEMTQKYKGKEADKMEIGIEVFKYIFKNSHKVKEEVFSIVAVAEGKTIEEVKRQSFPKTILAIKTIFSDKELVDFFKQAMQ